MYEIIRQVYSAVSKKGLSSILKQMKIGDGKLVGTNGTLTIGANVPELSHINCLVPADKFVKAMSIVDPNKLKTSITKTGKLSIRSGKFKALIATSTEEFPEVEITGDMVECNGLLDALKVMQPFMGDDASRRWSNGVRMTNDYVYATNNVIIARYDVKMKLKDMVIPKQAVNELLRIGKEPVGVIASDTNVTFVLDDSVWLNTTLINSEWPNIENFFTNEELPHLHAGLLKAVESVVPFCPDDGIPVVHFSKDGVHTREGNTSSTYEGITLPDSAFHAKVLTNILPYVTNVDWSKHPKPCPFAGLDGHLQGVLIGLRT